MSCVCVCVGGCRVNWCPSWPTSWRQSRPNAGALTSSLRRPVTSCSELSSMSSPCPRLSCIMSTSMPTTREWETAETANKRPPTPHLSCGVGARECPPKHIWKKYCFHQVQVKRLPGLCSRFHSIYSASLGYQSWRRGALFLIEMLHSLSSWSLLLGIES